MEESVKEVVAGWRKSVRAALDPEGKVPSPKFALLFVPKKWAKQQREVVESVMAQARWPKFAPFLGVLSEGDSLTLCTSLSDAPTAVPNPMATGPRLFFLGRKELEAVSALSVDPELHSKTGAAGMSLNGTALGAQAFLQREPQEVGSFLLFGDVAAGSGLLARCLSILDVSYPQATKAGLVVPHVDDQAPLVVGYRGRVAEKSGGLLGLALPSEMDTSIGLCGCRAVGLPLEVQEADLRRSAGATIRSVVSAGWADGEASWGVPGVVASEEAPLPPRRRSVSAAQALRDMAAQAGFARKDKEVWLGLPRGLRSDERSFKSAPGAGEWALYQWATTSAEGSVVLRGDGPRADGIGRKGVRKVQAFVSQPEPQAVETLARAYQLERLMKSHGTAAPQGRLLLAGGPGAVASVGNEADYDGCALGHAVIGSAGLVVGKDEAMSGTGTFSYANPRPTMLHRQAAGLVYLFP